jgi:ion channel POLLUX/CASTOR
MNKKPTISARLRYEFDKTMAAGAIALVGWLALISLVTIIVAGAVLAVTQIAPEGSEPLSFLEGFWASLMRTLDAGTMGGDTGWGYRLIMLLVTLAGIFIVSALIGVLSSGIEAKLDELRKGRSHVIEKDHTIIFNWSPSVFDIISELTIANMSRKRPRIVIMANMDKVEMEDEIAAKVANLRNTRVICRSGDPTDLQDIQMANPQNSRSVIILSPQDDNPDSQVIKTIVALVNDPDRRPEPYQIAAEIREARNMDVARAVGGKEAQLILADDLISRIVVHSSRESGLSAVYTELLDFDGCEIYTAEQPHLAGKSFAKAALAYDTSTLLGVCDKAGNVILNPPAGRTFKPGEKAVLIAEDDSMITPFAGKVSIANRLIRKAKKTRSKAERTLVLGWNRRGVMIGRELSRYVARGSLLTIAADTPELADETAGMELYGQNMRVELKVTDTSQRASLDALDIPSYDHVLVLGYSDHMPAQTADTRTLITLLHLRQIADKAGSHINVVSEMIDMRNRALAEVARADDFVVSNKLVSLMLAQASENENIAAIFEELLDADGSEIHMRPASSYVKAGVAVNFFTIAQAALARREVAIGYCRADGRVVVNPTKSQEVAFDKQDRIVVLSRD